MNHNILLELAVEKIRKDLGDFSATLFQIISVQENCKIQGLNLLLPNASYFIIRSNLFLLYQHNLISIKLFSFQKNFSKNFLKKIKFFSNVHQAIYRVRFPRFLAFSEYEFGETGKILIREILDKGQLTCKNLFEVSEKKTDQNWKKIEDILIQLARDGLISNSFFYPKEKNLSRGMTKPVRRNNVIPWKISVFQFNSSLKINMVLNLVQDSVFPSLKLLFRSSFSRIFSFETFKLNFQWFAMDTSRDFFFDANGIEENRNEINLVQFIENKIDKRDFLEIQNSFFRIKYDQIFLRFRNITIENIIKNRFGNKFLKVFRVLGNIGNVGEEKLLDECLLDEFEIRKILFEMFRIGFVCLEENPFKKKTPARPYKFYWNLNNERVKKIHLSEIIKSIFYIFLKLEKLNLNIIGIWNRKKNFQDEGKVFSQVLFLYDILGLSISRLDELLLFFY